MDDNLAQEMKLILNGMNLCVQFIAVILSATC